MISDAVISPCGKYRYRLWRMWGGGRRLVFIMLNPSTADADVDDPTIRKCIGFAKRLGYDGIDVVNLFAYRATDPQELRAAGWPIGPDNDKHIQAVLLGASVGMGGSGNAVCAWGAHAKTRVVRTEEVFNLLDAYCIQSWALKVNGDGTPAHPLMLPYSGEMRALRPIRAAQ